MRFERKIKLTFLQILFQNIGFVQNSLHPMAVLGYLPKLKRGLELAFSAHFLHGFFHTNAPHLILYQLAKFQ